MQNTPTAPQDLTQLAMHYAGVLSDLMMMGGIYLAPFLVLYLWYGLKRDFDWKIFDFLYVVVCLYVFTAFVAGGVVIGNHYGYGGAGAFIGIFGFWAMFNIMLRLKARKDFRNRI